MSTSPSCSFSAIRDGWSGPFLAGRLRRIAIGCLCLALSRPDRLAADGGQDAAALKQLSLEELMNVEVVSVSREPEKLLDAASAVQVVTGDEIQQSGASELPEALRLAGNLEVAQKNAHDWAISARGFDTDLSNKLLVMIDGRTVYTPLFSGVFWDVQNVMLQDLDRIEVISGPGGTQWGANAVNGVINIISKSAKETQGGYLEAGGGSQLEDFASLRYGGVLAPNVYYRVYGTYFDQGDELETNGQSAPDSWHMSQGGFRIDSDAVPQTTLTLQGDIYSGRENIDTGGVAVSGGDNLLGRWKREVGSNSEVTLQVYFDQTRLEDPIPKSAYGAAGILTDDLDTTDLDLQWRVDLGASHRLVWGAGYRLTDENDQNTPSLAFLPTHLNQNLYSAFAQDRWAILPKLALTAGTKVEHNDYTGTEWEPDVRLQWNFAADQMLWAAVSRAVRAPSRVERSEYEPNPPPAIVAPNSNFESEVLIADEVGYRAQFNRKVSGSVSAFYNDYNDVRSLDYTAQTIIPLYFANGLAGDTYGLEFSSDYQVTSTWRLHGSYDLLDEHLWIKPGQVDLNHALNETADPKHQFSIRSSNNLRKNVMLETALRWVDTLRINNGGAPYEVPSYFECDARIAWQPIPPLELSITGQNLLHNNHLEYGTPGPAQEEIQRSVYGKAAWHF